ncbi:P-loop containing nucleoside triphosphate hydrolase protein [Mortierella sp. GBAus27b]|nr:P-loop containing nucleoside triphosphate hydrolase protein [Mortierella sp. GBAus27b]
MSQEYCKDQEGWVLAAVLNIFEHRYEIRSSTRILLYYVVNVIAGTITTHTLSSISSTNDATTTNALYYTYFCFIILGVLVESWPRNYTGLQPNVGRYERANIFSRGFFHYIQHLISLGYKQPLQPSDVQDMMPHRIKTEFSYDHLQQRWDQHVAHSQAQGKEPRLMWLIVSSYGSQWIPIVIFKALNSVVSFVAPELMDRLLEFIASNSETDLPSKPIVLGIILSLGMFFSTVATALLDGQYFQLIMNMSIEVRTALVSMIYRKALKLSPAARQSETPGEINNHMSVDAERWSFALQFLPWWGSIPFEICIALWMLYRQLGWSALAGLGTIVIVSPLQFFFASLFEKSKEVKLEAMDNRIRLTSELMSSMKIVKLYGWESSFRDKVTNYRSRELKVLQNMGISFSFMTIMFSSVTLLMALVSFSVYATVGGPGGTPGDINSRTIFVSITLFGILNRPIGMLSHITGETIGLLVATRRIQKYLLEEELQDDHIERSDILPADLSLPVVEVQDGVFSWENPEKANESLEEDIKETKEGRQDATSHSREPSSESHYQGPTLKNINLSIQRKHLTAIVGRVGQGKSSLLHAIIGEMYTTQGKVRRFGRLAYAPQQAWIMNATLRDNILFGSTFDQEKYNRIIYAAGLIPDLDILPAGDLTEIGERGINLSGGQKQRVSLARAVYQDADIYLLDDPLSAVDAHVDQHLWEHLIGPNGLLKDKTRLLITHGIHHLSEVDQIVVLKDGSISETGRYQELLDSKKAFYQLIQDYSNESSKETRKEEHTSSSQDIKTTKRPVSGVIATADHSAKGQEDEKFDDNAELIEDESMAVGSTPWRIYHIYAKAASYRNVAHILTLFVILHGCQISSNLWLQNWVIVAKTTTHGIAHYMGVYAIFVISFMFLVVWTSYTTMVKAGIRASDILHARLLDNILRLPMSFFDTTPVGRIINRFSSDCFSIDEQLPWCFHDIFFCGGAALGSLIVIAMTTPIFLAVVPVILAIYIITQRYYVASSRNFKRIESISKSPMYQHFTETLNGVSTIRAMQCGLQFIKQNAIRSDETSNAHFVWAIGNRWLELRLEFLGSLIVLAAALFAVLARDSVSASMVGMSLSYALNITTDICWMVRCMCEAQFEMVAVERMEEYTKKDQEAPNITSTPIPEAWPAQGQVAFKNYSTRYREGMDLVLRDVSFEVQPRERVGIVGRTGAGKSSLTLALFRIIEAANSPWIGRRSDSDASIETVVDLEKIQVEENGGSIWIDGIDISTIGLETLRQNLAIIPQEPTLFVGTVRDNLDPFNQSTDAEIWEALERAHLKEYLSSIPEGLSYEVTQNGENFSVGQRSLVCLARALLRKTKILVLDEATAAVDVETDELIQRTIRQEFNDRTILTIAHRIKTIMDYDKILVLDKGRVQEFDTPTALLSRKESLFYRLAEQAGEL